MALSNWLELNRLSFNVDEKTILKPISAKLSEQKCLAVMGLSGSGKTTLMRLLLGLEEPSSGHVKVLGEVVSRLNHSELKKWYSRVGALFQSAALISDLSVKDNLLLPLQIRGIPYIEAVRKVKRILKDFDLAHTLHDLPGALSGGMKQRLGLARAIISSPELLILDEPLSAQDLKRVEHIESYLLNYLDQPGRRMIIVSHDPLVVSRLADCVWVLNQGRLIANMTPDKLMESEDPRVQSLLIRSQA